MTSFGTQDADRARLHLRAAQDVLDRREDDDEAPPVGATMAAMVRAQDPTARQTAADRRLWDISDRAAESIRTAALPGFTASSSRFDRAIIPWSALRAASTRAMATTPGPKGGYAVGVETLDGASPPWQDSVIGAANVQVIENLSANATIPRGSAVSVGWQGGEGTSATAVDEALGSVSVTAKLLFATVQCSVQLVRQAPALTVFLERLLLRSLRSALDTALLQGTGASGQPQGLATLPTASGIQNVSGTSLAWAGILSAQKLASASGVADPRMVWVGAPTVRETIGARERTTGSGRVLWDDGKIAGNPAIATPDAPASTLFVGDFSQAVLALFGPGIELRYDPANNFNSGLVAFQILCVCDIVFPQPSAFVRIGSIT